MREPCDLLFPDWLSESLWISNLQYCLPSRAGQISLVSLIAKSVCASWPARSTVMVLSEYSCQIAVHVLCYWNTSHRRAVVWWFLQVCHCNMIVEGPRSSTRKRAGKPLLLIKMSSFLQILMMKKFILIRCIDAVLWNLLVYVVMNTSSEFDS